MSKFRFFLAFFTLFNLAFANDFMSEFENYFENLDAKKDNQIQNPFFYGDLDAKFYLQAILGKRAKINDKWYEASQNLDDAKIVKISAKQGFVLLERSQQQFYLTLKRANHKVLIR